MTDKIPSLDGGDVKYTLTEADKQLFADHVPEGMTMDDFAGFVSYPIKPNEYRRPVGYEINVGASYNPNQNIDYVTVKLTAAWEKKVTGEN